MYPVLLGRLLGIDRVSLSYHNIYMCCFYCFEFCAAFLDINFDSCDEYMLYMVIPVLKLKTLVVHEL